MRSSRVLAVVTLMAVIGLAAVALARSWQAAPPSKLHRALQQAVQEFVAAQRHAAPQLRVFPAPQNAGTTCFVATQCSINPCVIPVASAVAVTTPAVSNAVPAPALPNAVPAPALRKAFPPPTLPNAGRGCPGGARVPKTLRVSAPTLSVTPR